MSAGFTGIEMRGHWAAFGGRAGKQPVGTEQGNSDLKSAWGSRYRGDLLISEIHPGETPPGTRNRQVPFLSLAPQHKYRDLCEDEHSTNTLYVTCLHQALPRPSLHSSRTAFIFFFDWHFSVALIMVDTAAIFQSFLFSAVRIHNDPNADVSAFRC